METTSKAKETSEEVKAAVEEKTRSGPEPSEKKNVPKPGLSNKFIDLSELSPVSPTPPAKTEKVFPSTPLNLALGSETGSMEERKTGSQGQGSGKGRTIEETTPQSARANVPPTPTTQKKKPPIMSTQKKRTILEDDDEEEEEEDEDEESGTEEDSEPYSDPDQALAETRATKAAASKKKKLAARGKYARDRRPEP